MRLRALLWGSIAAAATTGCVPKAKHELVEVQLHATRTALSASRAGCTTEVQTWEADNKALEAEITERQQQLDALTARADATDARLQEAATERVALLDEIDRLNAYVAVLRADLEKRTRGMLAPPEPPPPAVTLAAADADAAIADRMRAAVEENALEAERAAVTAAFASLASEDRIELLFLDHTSVLRIQTALLFQEGFTTLSPRGQQIVIQIAAALASIPGHHVSIEGHTDDRPIHSAEFPSNWDRAFSRAVAVLRALEGAGAPASLSAASFADTRPLADNATPEGRARNARVELLITPDPELLDRFEPTPPPEPGG